MAFGSKSCVAACAKESGDASPCAASNVEFGDSSPTAAFKSARSPAVAASYVLAGAFLVGVS